MRKNIAIALGVTLGVPFFAAMIACYAGAVEDFWEVWGIFSLLLLPVMLVWFLGKLEINGKWLRIAIFVFVYAMLAYPIGIMTWNVITKSFPVTAETITSSIVNLDVRSGGHLPIGTKLRLLAYQHQREREKQITDWAAIELEKLKPEKTPDGKPLDEASIEAKERQIFRDKVANLNAVKYGIREPLEKLDRPNADADPQPGISGAWSNFTGWVSGLRLPSSLPRLTFWSIIGTILIILLFLLLFKTAGKIGAKFFRWVVYTFITILMVCTVVPFVFSQASQGAGSGIQQGPSQETQQAGQKIRKESGLHRSEGPALPKTKLTVTIVNNHREINPDGSTSGVDIQVCWPGWKVPCYPIVYGAPREFWWTGQDLKNPQDPADVYVLSTGKHIGTINRPSENGTTVVINNDDNN